MRHIKTLVVDDNVLFSESIKFFLQEQAAIELVGFVENGAECLKFVDKKSVDLVILDVRMPGLEGTEVTIQLKKKYPYIKVIICTIWDEKDARNHAIRAGVDDYFVKGEPLSLLLKKIYTLFL